MTLSPSYTTLRTKGSNKSSKVFLKRNWRNLPKLTRSMTALSSNSIFKKSRSFRKRGSVVPENNQASRRLTIADQMSISPRRSTAKCSIKNCSLNRMPCCRPLRMRTGKTLSIWMRWRSQPRRLTWIQSDSLVSWVNTLRNNHHSKETTLRSCHITLNSRRRDQTNSEIVCNQK